MTTPTGTAQQMTVIDEIAAERKRQVEKEGWSSDHDDDHSEGQLATAAAVYATLPSERKRLRFIEQNADGVRFIDPWPWWDTYDDGGRSYSHKKAWFKPKIYRRDLIRAAALIVAEIERLDRIPTPGEAKQRS